MPVRAQNLPQPSTASYESDFNDWCHETAALIRERRWSEIDAEHLAEEIEALAHRDQREFISRLTVLLMHLLKWHIQPKLRSPSWRSTVREQRQQLELLLESSPSLGRLLTSSWLKVYRRAVANAADETNVDRGGFPAVCPWTPEQVLDSEFYPDAAK
jgi:hypothetical protein